MTELVIKFDKFKEVIEEHPENIEAIDSALEVLKFDKSIEVKFLQSLNIYSKSKTLLVMKFDILRNVNVEHP